MIIAGEASGDLHGGKVVRELRALRPECEIYGIGGDMMRDAGMRLIHHVREMAFLGFAEVVRHLPFIRRVLGECVATLRTNKPDVLLLIDYPGFNLKLARKAHQLGIPVVYYISPQVWAWKAGRVKKMRGVIDMMLVIFPFEVEIYRREQVPVEFVGHPLLEQPALGGASVEEREEFFLRNGFKPGVPLVGMFPGSRKQELHRMVPTFIETARLLKTKLDVQFAVAAAPTISPEILDAQFAGRGIPVLRDQTEMLQRFCDVALTKSGTSTLEMAVGGTPMVVLYKTSALSYRIGKSFALIEHIAMPNIVAGGTIVPEFIQDEATPERLAAAVHALLTDADLRAKMLRDLAAVRATLGTPGASRRVAQCVLNVGEQRKANGET